MPAVLFVCTGNQFRSPIAASCLIDFINRHPSPENWQVESAGTWTSSGLSASGLAIRIASQLGLPSLVKHSTRPVNQELLDKSDLILVMEAGQQEGIASEFHNVAGRLMLLSEIVGGIRYDIPDPADPHNNPQEIASELRSLIDKGGYKILEKAEALYQARQLQGKGPL